MNVVLVTVTEGTRIAIRSFPCLMGRHPQECAVYVPLDNVSRVHCVLDLQDGVLVVQDRASKNGTFVNGIRVYGSSNLASGDILRLAGAEFVVEISQGDDVPPSGVTKTLAGGVTQCQPEDNC